MPSLRRSYPDTDTASYTEVTRTTERSYVVPERHRVHLRAGPGHHVFQGVIGCKLATRLRRAPVYRVESSLTPRGPGS